MTTPEEVLQQWVDDFVDTYNKQPSKQTIQVWEYQIWELHFSEEVE